MKRKKLDEAADLLRERAGGTLDAAIILGSGFGGVLRDRIDATPLPYKKIGGMPEPTVPGHAGEALVGQLHGRRIVAFSGRFHLYEGYEPLDVVYPVAVAAHAGAQDDRADQRGGRRQRQLPRRRLDADRRSAQPHRAQPARRTAD